MPSKQDQLMTPEEQKEAKLYSLNFRVQALQQTIDQRINSLTSMSSLAAAVVAVAFAIGDGKIKHPTLAIAALILLTLLALFSFGSYLLILRQSLKETVTGIADLDKVDWIKEPPPQEIPKIDWFPEILFAVLVTGVLLFGLSLFPYELRRM